ncbi:JAB domain-containing protein [Actinomadura luteofluorescens]|nr:JAB domain-containing protein [Actinomadura glauciflava]
MARNHPSGRLEASVSDHRATEQLRDAADTVGLRFMGLDTAWARVA